MRWARRSILPAAIRKRANTSSARFRSRLMASKNQALAAMGTSFAFEARPEDAARYYRRSFDAQMEAKDLAGAAGTANALGRVYLESGNTQKAEQWYRTGYETARRIPHMPAAQLALWDMRWAHAQGRIAARRGQRAQALQHAAAVKRLLPTVADENQRAAYPYLVGYIDFYTRHYRTAIESLKAGQPGRCLRARPDCRVVPQTARRAACPRVLRARARRHRPQHQRGVLTPGRPRLSETPPS